LFLLFPSIEGKPLPYKAAGWAGWLFPEANAVVLSTWKKRKRERGRERERERERDRD
jgi:hypothetical protein